MTTATAPPPAAVDAGSLRAEQARLRALLARTRRRVRLQMALEFALVAASGAVALGVALVALDYWLRFGLTTRQVLGRAGLAGLLFGLGGLVLARLRAGRLDDIGLALLLDRVRPGTGQQVADVLQLPAQIDDERSGASPALVRLAVHRASDALAAVDWRSHWNARRTLVRLAGLLAVLAVPTAFVLAAPGAARLSWDRWLLGSTERWPQRTYLSVVGLGDGDRLLAPRDEPFVVDVRADVAVRQPAKAGFAVPGRGEPAGIIAAWDRPPLVPDAVRLRERAADGATRDGVMTAVGAGLFRQELPPASGSTTFDLRGGDDWLGPIRVERVDRPALAETRVRVRDPGASEGAWRDADAHQHLIFLPDTQVELTLVATEPVRAARVEAHPGAPPSVERLDPKSFVARLTLREALTMEINLVSESTGLASKPSFLSLGLLKDRDPRAILRAQGVGGHVTPVATIPLTMAANDDIGLAALRLQVERVVPGEDKAEPVTTKQTVPIPIAGDPTRPVPTVEARHDVDLAASPPPIGTALRLQAEAEDRSTRGAQVGRSGTLHFQVVSPDELFYEILIRQRAERAKFLAAYEAAGKLGATLAGTPSAEDYTAAARSLHGGTRQVELIAGRIGDSLAEMKLNQVGSPKSHRLLQDGVIDPILALNAGPAAEFRTTLQALAAGSKAQGDAEKARQLHGAVLARMKAILDQMSQWESFVDVVNQVAEVIKIQQNVLKATEGARETRNQEIFDEKP